MKHFLTLISLVFLSAAAFGQTFQYRPTAYTQPFVSTINSSAAAQTYLGLPSPTNTALLNTNQTFTGTNVFGGNVMVTNFANFARTMVVFETNNFFFPDLATAGQGLAGGNTTNTSTNIWLNTANYIPSNIFTITLPPMPYTNGAVSIAYDLEYTNSRPATGFGFVVSAGTNRVQIIAPVSSTGATYPYHRILALSTATIIQNQGSATSQLAANAGPPLTSYVSASQSYVPAAYVDTSSAWNMTFEWGAQTSIGGPLTNTFCRKFQVIYTIPADTRVAQ